jgi:TonB family protein
MRYPFIVVSLLALVLACSRFSQTQTGPIPADRVHLVARIPLQSDDHHASLPLPVAGDVTLPVLIHKVEPAIPAQERSRVREQPYMLFELTIDPSGDVLDVKTRRVNDQSLLPYVVAAIKQWKYKPATLRGKPVTVLYTVTFSYDVR